MSICFFHLACAPPRGYSICLLRLCIGFLRHLRNGILHTILTISSLCSLPQQMSKNNSTEFDRILSEFDLTKAAEKDSDGCVVVHLGFEFDSIQMQVTLPPIRSREQQMQSNPYFRSRRSHSMPLNQRSASSHIIVKSFHWVAPFCINSFLYYVVAVNIIVFSKFGSLVQQKKTFVGSVVSQNHGPQSH